MGNTMRKLILLIVLSLPVFTFAQQVNQGKAGTTAWKVKDVGLPDTKGQKTSANSTSVTVASDQTAVPVSGAVTATIAAGGHPCINPNSTLVSLGGATSAGPTTTQIIALSGSTKIYVCSLTVIGVSGTTPTFSLVQGTGSNCASNQGVLVPAWTTTAGALFAFANPVAVSTAAYALCWKTTGTSPVQNYQITYVQQ